MPGQKETTRLWLIIFWSVFAVMIISLVVSLIAPVVIRNPTVTQQSAFANAWEVFWYILALYIGIIGGHFA